MLPKPVVVHVSALVDLLLSTDPGHTVHGRHATPELLSRAWARHEQLRPADTLYVVLAEHLNAPLITTDPRLEQSYAKTEVIVR